MRLRIHARAFAGAAIFTASTLVAVYGLAAPNDYRFELVQAQPAGSGKTTVTVRLVHVPDNKPVPRRRPVRTKTDMTPDGMADMTGKVSPLPSDQPGIYRFQVEPAWPANGHSISAPRCKARPGRCAATSSMRRK